MKNTILAVTALVFVGAQSSVEVVSSDAKPTYCESLGKVQAGDRFAGLDRETASKAVKEQAKTMNAKKVFLDVTFYKHPKLGKQYVAKAITL